MKLFVKLFIAISFFLTIRFIKLHLILENEHFYIETDYALLLIFIIFIIGSLFGYIYRFFSK
jgi:hypothetical protein